MFKILQVWTDSMNFSALPIFPFINISYRVLYFIVQKSYWIFSLLQGFFYYMKFKTILCLNSSLIYISIISKFYIIKYCIDQYDYTNNFQCFEHLYTRWILSYATVELRDISTNLKIYFSAIKLSHTLPPTKKIYSHEWNVKILSPSKDRMKWLSIL